jgi:multiple sugar transport system ATP-binding protein
MTMGDRIVVMKEGTVQQAGSPLSLYNEPANKFVGGFISSPPMNFLSARLVQAEGGLIIDEGSFSLPVAPTHAGSLMPYRGRDVCLGIRPEDLRLAKPGEAGNFKAWVSFVEPLGAEINLYAATAANSLVARARPGHAFKAGDIVEFSPAMERARYFDPETGKSLLI